MISWQSSIGGTVFQKKMELRVWRGEEKGGGGGRGVKGVVVVVKEKGVL